MISRQSLKSALRFALAFSAATTLCACGGSTEKIEASVPLARQVPETPASIGKPRAVACPNPVEGVDPVLGWARERACRKDAERRLAATGSWHNGIATELGRVPK